MNPTAPHRRAEVDTAPVDIERLATNEGALLAELRRGECAAPSLSL